MKIGIAVFAYNRYIHLQQVLDGLRNNESVDKVYFFQDGLKCEKHRPGWEAVKSLINSVSWCETVCSFSEDNKGLAKSLVHGINFVLEENEAVIVLEDDCVPSANFISFMNQCFDRYKDNEKVYSISGYTWPIELEESPFDVYGCGRHSSWGWGTWKDRWRKYKMDANILRRLKKGEKESLDLATWGNDLEGMLVDSITCQNDSWAVYWALNIIDNQGICINPYHSLIQNIGMDGTGVHCGISGRFDVDVSDGTKKTFILPDDIKILESTKRAVADIFGSYTATATIDEKKEKVLIYGLGNFFHQKEKILNDKYQIIAFVDRKRRGWYAGKRVISPEEIDVYDIDKVIIMIQNAQESVMVYKKLLLEEKINKKQIILGNDLF